MQLLFASTVFLRRVLLDTVRSFILIFYHWEPDTWTTYRYKHSVKRGDVTEHSTAARLTDRNENRCKTHSVDETPASLENEVQDRRIAPPLPDIWIKYEMCICVSEVVLTSVHGENKKNRLS